MTLFIKREDMSDVRSITHEAEIHHHVLQSLAHPLAASTINTFASTSPSPTVSSPTPTPPPGPRSCPDCPQGTQPVTPSTARNSTPSPSACASSCSSS
ncbi:hypothetical protein CGCSCA4_v001718 [Colletotrichum siamense]|uniref:Uncharacterized protein n=1 Tax=Colletotrichum siamense TaxID=690259 RepID=A0A9P5F2G1_COLSI|nr:hypothetical protein CGCSCA4_v001718 [Colletotrichum siamense]KAF4864606.1 hypothetical protein CGCSCA2_v001854 [Colletotrichum siamense]